MLRLSLWEVMVRVFAHDWNFSYQRYLQLWYDMKQRFKPVDLESTLYTFVFLDL